MATLDKLVDSPVMHALQGLGQKMQASPTVQAITNGMMGTMNLILAGSVFSIIASLLTIFNLTTADSVLYQQLMIPYNMTMNLMSMAIAFSVGYVYTKNLKLGGELANGIVSMVLFLMVSAPIQTVTLADGSTMSAIDTTMLGGTGIFTAMLIPIVAVKIIDFCQRNNVTIKMPDSIPPFLSDSFATLVPLVINIVLWRGLSFACETLTGASLPAILMGLLSAPLGVLASGPGIIVLGVLAMVFWFFGMHGTGIVYIVLLPVMLQAFAANADLVANGQAPVFNAVFLFSAFCCAGGTGNTLPLAVLCLRAKSEQLKAVAKAGLVPALFNISEPMVFGTPIMYNPIIGIPFILNGLFVAIPVWVGYLVGFFQPGYIMIMTSLPICMAEFATSMAWQNLLIAPLGFLIGLVVYAPFVRMYDKQLCEKEAAERAEAELAA